MISYLLRGESDVQFMRDMIALLGQESTIVDFEETMMLNSVRATTRLWQEDDHLVGFAYVDDFNNLRFEVAAGYHSTQLENEIVAWGITCIKNRNVASGGSKTLDASFNSANSWQIALLERSGFERSSLRTLYYARPFTVPIVPHTFPAGFSWRCVAGEHEVEKLVALHRAAFGTENMTVERRLAIMHSPSYVRKLDLVAVAANGELAAFCICNLDEEVDSEIVGYTDPIGTNPRYQQRGLGKALVTTGLQQIRNHGATVARLGTSSDNVPMQRLAELLGFTCIAEKLWFSRAVTQ